MLSQWAKGYAGRTKRHIWKRTLTSGLTREIFKHAAIYSVSAVLGRLISFIMLPFYARIFRAEGYGVIAMVDATLGMLPIIFSSGFQLAITRIYHGEGPETQKRVYCTAVVLVWSLGTLMILLPMMFSTSLSRIFLGTSEYRLIFILALITFVIDTAGLSASAALIIRQQSILYAALNIIRLVLGLALNIWLVLILEVGVVGVFVTALVTAVIMSSLLQYLALKDNPLVFDKGIAEKLVRFQLPLVPGDLVAFFGRQTERFVVRFLIDIRSVGILEMAYKFPPLLNLFISIPFGQAWRTKAFEIAEKDHNAPTIIGNMFGRYLFLMVFAGITLAVGIDDLLVIMTPSEFWPAAQIVKVEIVTTILASANVFFMFGLIYRNRTGDRFRY